MIPDNWIDQQRGAGMGRGNIFRDILAEAASRRKPLQHRQADREADRAASVQRIKLAAQVYDGIEDREGSRRTDRPNSNSIQSRSTQ